MVSKPVIFIIAGEASGDLLGGRLIAALKDITNGHIDIKGIGGDTMAAQGLQTFFPMDDLSVMGIAEVLPQLPVILRRLKETEREILKVQPDAVITIDAPDFCFRVIKRLKKKGFTAPCIHYVAPSVWAWRPGRARKVAKFLDHVLCLLPFEPPYFERYGLPATYIGHSIVETARTGQGRDFRNRHNIPVSDTVVTLLPGSRKGEIARHLDLFLDTAAQIRQQYGPVTFVIPTLPTLKQDISDKVKTGGETYLIVSGEGEKRDAFAASDVALAASGTVTLELAVADVPTVAAYRMAPLTAFIARRLVKTPYVSLANIIMGREVIPEYLLEKAQSGALADAVLALLTRGDVAAKQRRDFKAMRNKINYNAAETPSRKAARTIMHAISES